MCVALGVYSNLPERFFRPSLQLLAPQVVGFSAPAWGPYRPCKTLHSARRATAPAARIPGCWPRAAARNSMSLLPLLRAGSREHGAGGTGRLPSTGSGQALRQAQGRNLRQARARRTGGSSQALSREPSYSIIKERALGYRAIVLYSILVYVCPEKNRPAGGCSILRRTKTLGYVRE
jgi:hypothetical protein